MTAHEEVIEFIRHNPRAVVATRRRDGTAQLSPVLVAVDAESRVVISTRESAMKTLNLRRFPHASLLIINAGFFGEWHSVDGPVEIISLPDAMDEAANRGRFSSCLLSDITRPTWTASSG